MEGLAILLGVGVLAAPWVLAIASLVRSARIGRRLDAIERRLARIERTAGAPRPAAAGEPLPTVAAPPVPAAEPAVPAAPVPARLPAPAPVAPTTEAAPGLPTPPQLPPLPPPPAGMAPDTLEQRVVLVWLTRIGALAVLAGTAYFFKYAVDNQWIGPTGRVALGTLAGAALLAFGEAIRLRARDLYVQALQGTGVAILFAAAYASHALYALVPVGVAFAAVAAIALVGGALAVRGRSELVLALALAGGLLAPVILSTGTDRPAALFGYLALLGGLALAASARLGFRIVPFLALAGTAALFAGWHARFFDVSPAVAPLGAPEIPAGAYAALGARAVPLALVALLLAEWLFFWEKARRAAPPAWATGWLGASLALAHVLPWALLHDRPAAGGAALVLAGGLAAALLVRGRAVPFQPAATALGALLLAASALESHLGDRHAWLWAACAFAAAQLASVAHAFGIRREPPTAPRIATAVLAALALSGFALGLTGEAEGLLRAAVVGAAGAALLALGAAALRTARAQASVLLGAALAAFAGAAALLLSGASITLVWAALGAVAAVLAARDRDPFWLAGAAALLAAAIARALGMDLAAPAEAVARFVASAGREGALRPRPLLNARSLALAGTAVALLVAARRCAREAAPFRATAAAFAVAGHGLLVTLAVVEVRGLALTLPAPPPAGDEAAFRDYGPALWSAMAAQAGRLDTLTTVVLGACAAALVAAGFAARDAFHRWLGLALFGAALGKLVLFDVWRLSRLEQVAVLLAIGLLMLAAAFLYARYGSRILRLLDGGPRPGAPGAPGALLALVAAGGLAAAGPAAALDRAPFREVRPIAGVDAAGLWRVEVDAALYRASAAAAGTLADVRIEGPGGREVPWALRDVAPAAADHLRDAVVVDPVVLPGGAVRAVLDLGRAGERHDTLRLALEGDDFLRAVRLESSADGRRFGVLAEGARVYAVRGLPAARRTEIRHPPSDARWLRVTLLPGPGTPPRIQAAQVVRAGAATPALGTLALGAPALTRSADGRTSMIELDLGAPGLPVSSVALDVASPAFERVVRVLASADRSYWAPAGGGVIWRALPGAEGAREELRVAASTGGRRFVRLEISDGDAPPLAVRGAAVAWPAQELVFRAEAPGPHTLLLGGKVAPPAYDLAAVLARTPSAPAARATLGPPTPNPVYAPAEPPRPFTERHRLALGAGVAALLGALALWAVRLLRAQPPA